MIVNSVFVVRLLCTSLDFVQVIKTTVGKIGHRLF